MRAHQAIYNLDHKWLSSIGQISLCAKPVAGWTLAHFSSSVFAWVRLRSPSMTSKPKSKADPLALLATEACRARDSLDDEASNRATTPTPLDEVIESWAATVGADEPRAPMGHFAPIGMAAPIPRAPTPVFKPTAASAPSPKAPPPLAEASVAQWERTPGPFMFCQPGAGLYYAQPMAMAPMARMVPVHLPQVGMPALPGQVVQPQLAMPMMAFAQPHSQTLAAAHHLAFSAPDDDDRSPRCLGRLLTSDCSGCDSHFNAPVGGTLRFEHKFCNCCRAKGIQVLASRVRLIDPEHEVALSTAGFSHAQQRRFWSYSPLAPARFHLFNDKARCTGQKIIVFEKPLPDSFTSPAMLPVRDPEVACDGSPAVRLWVSYGTLTMQRSRKAFKPSEPLSQPAPSPLVAPVLL